MKDFHVARFVASALWAILPEKMDEIVAVLARHAAGVTLTPEEIQARIGPPAPAASQRGAVAVLPVRGVIAHRMGSLEDSSGGTSSERLAQQYRALMQHDGVSAIVLDVDSPGGAVAGVPELVAEMQALKGRKPVIAVANSLMASAAYWIASQADEIVATPSSNVGSVGIFTAHKDMSSALEKAGVKVTMFTAGKYKADGLAGPLSEETKALIQSQVDSAYDSFVKAIAKGRGVDVASVRNGYGEGHVLDAKAALAAGMVDRIATLDETLARVVKKYGAAAGMRAEADDAQLEAVIESVGAFVDATTERAVQAVDAEGDWESEHRARRLSLA